MPFKSQSQAKACFAKKDAGKAKGWNCEEWAHATPSIKKLPEHVDKKAAAVLAMEKQASTVAQYLGVHAAGVALGVRR